jgi:hypothetical protein
MKFKIVPHSARQGDVVEVYDDNGGLLYCIYPEPDGRARSLRVVSKYLVRQKGYGVDTDDGANIGFSPSLNYPVPGYVDIDISHQPPPGWPKDE